MDKLETIVVQEETQDDSEDDSEDHLMIGRKIAVEILSNYYF